jgi:hypothetical protein
MNVETCGGFSDRNTAMNFQEMEVAIQLRDTEKLDECLDYSREAINHWTRSARLSILDRAK